MIYADKDITEAKINHLLNRNPSGQFSAVGDTSAAADQRYSDEGVTAARRIAGQRILDAIGKNIAHPFWGILKTDVLVTNGQVIPACYGEIGVPMISAYDGGDFEEGLEADSDEVVAYRNDRVNTFTDFYGDESGLAHDEEYEGITSPFTQRYATANGVIRFTGHQCKIPMIVIPTTEGADDTYVDERIPLALQELNVKLALPILVKEGDSLIRVASWLGGLGEAELFAVSGGAVSVKPIDYTRGIQTAQRYNS